LPSPSGLARERKDKDRGENNRDIEYYGNNILSFGTTGEESV